ncbi:MAG TPA: bifunctional phosphoribosyl-AMP cyclohydrolase/phosphoribosyl-ATP diphosphatase HisIE [Brumimicrobium sp.]|nr:bifunctional phosphoribosyl-AMP cyclohydrolase/phosphoribosyl-ATP diphosphatase HisIE [Brumimicrobium sp.]
MKVDFEKNDGVLPVIVQDVDTYDVLMFAYMNEEAYDITLATKEVTFFSKTTQNLWIKGDSENLLKLHTLEIDCKGSTLLLKAEPLGAICEKGTTTCWGDTFSHQFGIIEQLEKKINERYINPKDSSYISSLFSRGVSNIAEKTGKEAIEMIIQSAADDKEEFLKEGADLLFHYLILLKSKGYTLNDVLLKLKEKR